MFFVLSKTLGMMLLPTNFLLGAGAAVVVLLVIAGFSPLGSWLLYPLEARFPPWDASKGAPDGIVVLGGPIDPDLSAAHGTPVVSGGADRLIAAAALSRRYPDARVIYTGGSANLISGEAREADYASELFESLGVAKTRLLMERRARNTQENAVYAKAMAAPKPGERWLLVTSAYHMPRAIGVFRQQGFAVEPYPVDWRVGGRADLLGLHNFAVDGLYGLDVAIREWMGLVAYRLSGRIGEIFPGPHPP